MEMGQRERLKRAYNKCFCDGFSESARAHISWYIEALSDMDLISSDEAARVQECVINEIPKLTDDYIDFWM